MNVRNENRRVLTGVKIPIRRIFMLVFAFLISFCCLPLNREVFAAESKKFFTVNVSDSTFHDKGYKDSDGNVAYCANQNLPGPGSDGMTYTKVNSNAAYDYLMFHGYPNTNTINGKKWSNNDARDITQYTAWLIELGHGYNRDSESEAWNDAADKLLKGGFGL